MVSSTSTSSAASSQRVQTSSQRVQHMTTSEMKASSMKSDLTELKSSISEMKNLSAMKFEKRLVLLYLQTSKFHALISHLALSLMMNRGTIHSVT